MAETFQTNQPTGIVNVTADILNNYTLVTHLQENIKYFTIYDVAMVTTGALYLLTFSCLKSQDVF